MDFSGNVKNPFLFDDPAPPADVGDAAANPFLIGGAFDYAANYTGINPFSDQIDDSSAAAAGLFGDATAYPTDMNPFGTVTSDVSPFGEETQQTQADFFGAPVSQVNQVSDDLFGSPTAPQVAHHPPAPPARPPAPSSPIVDFMSDGPVAQDATIAPARPPPPRPPPPSKETKDLLQTVIGAMEATTDTLHEKLNTTRTPCPSPGSGAANSRSPTPDIQVTSPKKDSDAFSAIFGQTIDMSDHEMDETKTSTAASPAPAPTISDDFDLFGDTPAQKPKTNQDILSLFNKPQQTHPKQIDLLFDDFLSSDIPSKETEVDKQDAPDLLSGPPADERKPVVLLSGEDESKAPVLPTPSDKEFVSSEPPALTESCIPVDNQSEPAVVEESVSPEQVSEQTDSEPTVIEASSQDAGEEANKVTIMETEAQDSSSVTEEKVEAMEVFGSPEPIPPVVSNEQSDSLDTSDHLGTPLKPTHVEPVTEISSLGDQSIPDAADAFGVSDIPSSTSGPKDSAIDAFGDSSTLGETDAFGIPDAFGAPSKPDSGTALFGDTSSSFSNSSTTSDALFSAPQAAAPAASLFGDISQPAPPASPAASIFSDSSQPVPPGSPANSFFGDVAQPAPPASPAAGLFSNTPTSTASSFDIFGSEASPVPVASGADSIGAALFGSSAPAPNVGMSLFGAGNEPSLDIFAESEGNTMVNPFAPTSTAPASVLEVKPVPTSGAGVKVATDEEFDAFAARFDSAVTEEGDELHADPFASTVRGESLLVMHEGFHMYCSVSVILIL